jgi:hypothetical protein
MTETDSTDLLLDFRRIGETLIHLAPPRKLGVLDAQLDHISRGLSSGIGDGLREWAQTLTSPRGANLDRDLVVRHINNMIKHLDDAAEECIRLYTSVEQHYAQQIMAARSRDSAPNMNLAD